MDTLSTSISNTFKVPSSKLIVHHQASSHDHQNLIRNHHHLSHFSSISSTCKIRRKSCSSTFNKTATNSIFPHLLTSRDSEGTTGTRRQQHSEPPGGSYQKAVSGYAVALLDLARCNNVLHLVERDVTRLYKWLTNSKDRNHVVWDKGEISIKQVMKHGRFHKYLVKLVNLLVEKNKTNNDNKVVDIVSAVLLEFKRIFNEELNINGISNNNATQVVLVPAGLKLQENQAMEIARRVQKLSGGAAKVVMMRQQQQHHIVDNDRRLRVPSFAY